MQTKQNKELEQKVEEVKMGAQAQISADCRH
jgi:hypothetical protein